MKSLQITFDLETLGNRPNAPIVQIGAVKFNKDGIIDTFIRTIDIDSLSKYNFFMDYNTLKWWFAQEDAAIKSVMNGVTPLKEALIDFNKWIDSSEVKKYNFWSHATFDPPILHNNMREVGIDSIIHYSQHKDIRTLNELVGKVEVERKGIAHNALDDAIFQAEYIQLMLNKV